MQHVALATASSGIAATLLEGDKTAHSAFKLPLNLNNQEKPTFNIGKDTAKAYLLSSLFGIRQPCLIRTGADEVHTCIKKSYLWTHITRIHLSTNMRVH